MCLRSPTSAADTRAAAAALAEHGIDVLMFAGGDGTARDLTEALPKGLPVIGVPAGVKMHSGVFTVTPRDAADLIALILDGGLVAADTAEVRDVDEAALREGRVATRYYGELDVARIGGFLQHVKTSGREVEDLVLAEIAESIAERAADASRRTRARARQHAGGGQTTARHGADAAGLRPDAARPDGATRCRCGARCDCMSTRTPSSCSASRAVRDF